MSIGKHFPGTRVEATFLDVQGYAPIFRERGRHGHRLGSVNAGNSDTFYVLNSRGLNHAFDAVFQLAGQYPRGGPDPYERIHGDLFRRAENGIASSRQFSAADPLQFAIALRPTPDDPFQGLQGNDGTIFIDIFKESLAPHRNPDNYAMVYVCPPYGPSYASEADFLAAVEETARNIVRAVRRYNSSADSDAALEPIETLRQCLYSSGIYKRAGTSGDALSLHLCEGLMAELRADAAGLREVEFENGTGDDHQHIFAAVKELADQWPTADQAAPR